LSSRCCQPADDQRHSCRCVLLVLYPLIDAVATLIDARSQHGSARQWLLVNAGSSTVAAIALGVAATSGVTAVFAVFGVWAAVSGAAQLIVVLRRRAAAWQPVATAACQRRVGHRRSGLPHRGSFGHPRLGMLAIYAATGGVEFVIQAWLLARRRRQHRTRPEYKLNLQHVRRREYGQAPPYA
jgi:hypothetical protein